MSYTLYMAFIEWNDTLNTNITEIDEQHRQIVALINALSEAVRNRAAESDMKALFEAIARDTKAHFETEERLFRMHSYPERSAHAELHRQLETQVESLSSKIRTGAMPVNDSVLLFLRDWFITHIEGSDRLFGFWIQSRK